MNTLRDRRDPTRDTQIVVVIDRQTIEQGSLDGPLEILNDLVKDRDSAIEAMGRVSLVFVGYENDPRELPAIEEVRAWFARLTYFWPYWAFFASRVDNTTIPLVFMLLVPGRFTGDRNEVGELAWKCNRVDDIRQTMLRLYGRQNELVERLGIPESLNMRASEEFADAFSCAIG